MRFEIRFNNGYYKVFDTVNYTDAEMCGTLIEAERACLAANIRRG